MKITGFRPLILTKDAAAAIDMFEDLGFALRHTKTGIEVFEKAAAARCAAIVRYMISN